MATHNRRANTTDRSWVRHQVGRHAGLSAGAALALAATSLLAASPAHATYSGRDGLIAFVADSGSGAQLYTVRSNGAGLRQLSNLEGDVVGPDWSPDGRTIAYEHDLPGDEGSTVELVRADGSHRRTLAQEPGVFIGSPTFTPDGSRLVTAQYDPATNVSGIWSLDLATSRRRFITSGPGTGVADPQVSPDGRRLSFLADSDGQPGFGLYTCALDGSRLKELVAATADLVDRHDWAPSANRLASSDNHDHLSPGLSENVFIVRPNGTHRTYLTHFSGGDVNAVIGSYSPDGQSIAFRLEDHGQFALYRMSNDGRSPRAILPLSSLKPRYIDWGPAQGTVTR